MDEAGGCSFGRPWEDLPWRWLVRSMHADACLLHPAVVACRLGVHPPKVLEPADVAGDDLEGLGSEELAEVDDAPLVLGRQAGVQVAETFQEAEEHLFGGGGRISHSIADPDPRRTGTFGDGRSATLGAECHRQHAITVALPRLVARQLPRVGWRGLCRCLGVQLDAVVEACFLCER